MWTVCAKAAARFNIAETERLLRFEDPPEVALSCAEMDASNLDRKCLTFYLDRRKAEKSFRPVDAVPQAEAPRQQTQAAKKHGAGKDGER